MVDEMVEYMQTSRASYSSEAVARRINAALASKNSEAVPLSGQQIVSYVRNERGLTWGDLRR